MSLEEKVQYLLDRSEVQERIALYGLGQDYHQPGFKNQNSYNEWSEVLPVKPFNLKEYIEMMRGKDSQGGGLDKHFRVWAHLEHPVQISINGDEASSVSLHIHTHETKIPKDAPQLLATGSPNGSGRVKDGGLSSGL